MKFVWAVNLTLHSNEINERRLDRFIYQLIHKKVGQWLTSPPVEFIKEIEESFFTLSRSQAQTLLENQCISWSNNIASLELNRIILHSKSKILHSGFLFITILPPKTLDLSPKDIPIEIIYQDLDIAVINKPQGLSVHPSTTENTDTLINSLLFHLKDLSNIGGVQRPGIVHRIDKNTSGALVIAKTNSAHHQLTEIFSKHEIERKYWAICYSSPPTLTGTIESIIGRHPNDRKKMASHVRNGKKAITHYKVIEKYTRQGRTFASLIEATLHTGRTHQVRVHLNDIGCSLLGDNLYGIPTKTQPKWTQLPREVQDLVLQLPGQSLHAKILGFKHPSTQEPLYFEATPPPLFTNLLNLLRIYLKE